MHLTTPQVDDGLNVDRAGRTARAGGSSTLAGPEPKEQPPMERTPTLEADEARTDATTPADEAVEEAVEEELLVEEVSIDGMCGVY